MGGGCLHIRSLGDVDLEQILSGLVDHAMATPLRIRDYYALTGDEPFVREIVLVRERVEDWTQYPFTIPAVNRLESLRVPAPKSAQGIIMKCIGNNSYGKTVERLEGVDMLLAPTKPEGYSEYPTAHDDDETFAHVWFRFAKPLTREFHQPQLGAFITAHVRMVLRRAILLAPDAWQGRAREEKEVIEALDKGIASVIGPLMTNPELLLIVTADHSTPSSGSLIHSGETVPLIMYGEGVRRDEVQRFDEISAAAGALGSVRGKELMYLVLNHLERAKLQGLMDAPRDQPFWPGDYEPFRVG